MPELELVSESSEMSNGNGRLNRYSKIIERVFFAHYAEGAEEVEFERAEFESIAQELEIKLPKNLGDIIYSFRYRASLPDSVLAKAPEGKTWIIRPAGRGQYKFVAATETTFAPDANWAETKVLDSTPGVIEKYASGDEQALLAKLRYNRLVDIFTGLTCYSLQNHLRTTLPNGAQVETDEVYIGVDKRGAHYVLPVQAKSEKDALGVVQVEQDIALCQTKFPALICRPIGAQFMEPNLIAIFEFAETDQGIKKTSEQHYRLVPPEEMSAAELEAYRNRPL